MVCRSLTERPVPSVTKRISDHLEGRARCWAYVASEGSRCGEITTHRHTARVSAIQGQSVTRVACALTWKQVWEPTQRHVKVAVAVQPVAIIRALVTAPPHRGQRA